MAKVDCLLMAKYLTTTAVSYELENLIKKATDKVILISPYLKLNDRIFQLLEDADKLRLDVRVVYGKEELQPDQTEKLSALRSVRVTFLPNLHAKCYLNEKVAIVTSMNLYEFSQVNNCEMGILVEKSVEPELYQEIYDDVQRLIRTSVEVEISVVKVAPRPAVSSSKPSRSLRERHDGGFCIRCKGTVPLNPERPYCPADYERWAEYKNEDYADKYCHGCGKKHGATMRKPLCRECWERIAA